jgi:hypothetical protein
MSDFSISITNFQSQGLGSNERRAQSQPHREQTETKGCTFLIYWQMKGAEDMVAALSRI